MPLPLQTSSPHLQNSNNTYLRRLIGSEKINEIAQYPTLILSTILFKDITNKALYTVQMPTGIITKVYLKQSLAITGIYLGKKARQPKDELCTDSLYLIITSLTVVQDF